ncbi:vacuolar protein sorting-associated protein 33A [Thecamonas trahens ATCC 50062]|uniref:Vacuolar protein sorting-associated protein 33A n=1 Tax=Thecamonas trahens ATCC 50062 TaxID=461836 RepID=A0A0L0DHS7_THETB|nr:vacuolar protein sorting-associated protein 33A [Thecamonas trahens ATCC 50062]KNC51656.1 vacuolar protein sorting-associated protein 33A [Thecamonas trahens ATCC 50062]|eukprot:XP_013755794.1 vacuolar protein sorting-associated protein 33A [Thecamonas trahens ATCC 50062]
MAANLSGAVVNLAALREHAKEELMDYLDMIRGDKELVIDSNLTGPLGLVTTVPFLQQHGVANLRKLEAGALRDAARNVVYITRPTLKNMKMIARQIRGAVEGTHEYFVLFAPRKTLICERVLEEEGVLGDCTLFEFAMDLIPLDDDVLSLEMESAFRECYLDGDRTALYSVATSLMKIQAMYGTIPHIMGAGPAAKLVADMMMRMAAQSSEANMITPEIDRVILIDRAVDLVTPLCTPLTYEGLINEEFGIKNTFVWLDPAMLGPDGPSGTGRQVKHPLNSNDKLYTEIRDHNFAILGPLLHAKAEGVRQSYDMRHEVQTISDVKAYVGTFKDAQAEHKSLTVHTNITEALMRVTRADAFHRQLEAEQAMLNSVDSASTVAYIEECINKQEPLTKVLRLICILSLTLNGVKSKMFDFLRREIVQAYGFEHMFTLHNLEKLGLFKRSEGKSSFPLLVKNFNLLPDEVNEADPDDISYVFSGYAPLSVRLIELASRPGSWAAIPRPVAALIPEPMFEAQQEIPQGISLHDDLPPAAPGADPADAMRSEAAQRSRVTLVVYIGGIAYAELAAIRFLASAATDRREDFIVATTKLISGRSLMEQCMEQLETRSVGDADLAGASF